MIISVLGLCLDFHKNASEFQFGRLSFESRDLAGKYFTFAANVPEAFDNEWHLFVNNYIDMSENQAEIYVDGVKKGFSVIF